jgi:hypothetical protein
MYHHARLVILFGTQITHLCSSWLLIKGLQQYWECILCTEHICIIKWLYDPHGGLNALLMACCPYLALSDSCELQSSTHESHYTNPAEHCVSPPDLQLAGSLIHSAPWSGHNGCMLSSSAELWKERCWLASEFSRNKTPEVKATWSCWCMV